MALSYELISQFAKLTKSDNKTNTESTVYGTIKVDENGNKYVKLDGSDQLTPLDDENRPVADTTMNTAANANDGERVSVLIKNHTATVTGNISSPAARTGDVEKLEGDVTKIQEFDILIGEQVRANEAYIKKLQTDKAEVGDLTAATAKITELEAKKASVEDLNAATAEITNLKTTKLDAEIANAKFATIENLTVTNQKVNNIEGEHASFRDLTTERLSAVDAEIEDLTAKDAEIEKLVAKKASVEDLEAADAKIANLTAKDAEIENLVAEKASVENLDAINAEIKNLDNKYANIDFANINEAAVRKIFSDTGLIRDLVVGDSTVTGELVGVTIKGDLIEGNTVVADKLVVKGDDGLYYKLNMLGVDAKSKKVTYEKTSEIIAVVPDSSILMEEFIEDSNLEVYCYIDDAGVRKYYTIDDGVCYAVDAVTSDIEVKQTDYNSLHGSVITANSITAEKIRVEDLVAFGATIGGFHITKNALYSGVKESVKNTNPGVYLDRDGQFALGDMHDYLRYFKDTEGNYKLEIISKGISSQVKAAVDDIDVGGRNYIRNSDSEIIVELTGGDVLVDLDHSPAILDCPAEEMVVSFDVKSDTIIDWRQLQWCFYLQHETIEYVETTNIVVPTNGVKIEGVTTIAGNDVYSYLSGDDGSEQRYYTKDTNDVCYDVTTRTTNPISISGELSTWDPMTTEYERRSYIIKYADGYGAEDINRVRFVFAGGSGNVYIKNVKLEAGNKATDWTPAPEDMENDISAAQNAADSVSSRLANAESMIQQLSDSIAYLVRNGESREGSLVRQEADGLYYFDISGLIASASESANGLAELEGIVLDANGEIDVLKSTAAALQTQTEYVRSYTDENGHPCLELGEGDSKFKVYITNTQISFADDTSVPAYISNQRLMIEKATVKNELQFGDETVVTDGVWVWQKRTNGNLGLLWKGVSS